MRALRRFWKDLLGALFDDDDAPAKGMPRSLSRDEILTIQRYEICPACKETLIETGSKTPHTVSFICRSVACGTTYTVGTGPGTWGISHANEAMRRASLAWDDGDGRK